MRKGFENFNQLGKTFDNTVAISAKRIRLDNGYATTNASVISTDNYGNLGFSNTAPAPSPSTQINIFHEADDLKPRESTTLAGAYAKARLTATFAEPVCINVFPGTYYETDQIVWDTDLVTLQGVKGYYVCQFILTTNLTNNVPDPLTGLITQSAWIYNTASGGEWYDIYLDANANADYTVYVTNGSADNGMDIWRCWFLNGRLWACYCAGTIYYSSSNFGLATLADNGVTSHGAMWIDAGYVIMDYMGITNGVGGDVADYSVYTYFKLTNAAYVQYRVAIIGGYGGTAGTTGHYFFDVDASVADVYSGFVYGFTTYFKLRNSSRVSSKNIVYGGGNMIDSDSTCLFSFAGDQAKISQYNFTGLTSENINGFLNDPTKENKLGFHIAGNLTVGNPFLASESWFGQGSTTMVTADYASSTPSAVNKTTALTMGQNLGASLFGATGVNSDFFVGHSLQFYAIEMNITTAMTTGAIEIAYWNGAAWVALNFMFSQGAAPYTSYGNATFTALGRSFCRFDTTTLSTLWTTTTVNGGTSAYYIRFRVTTILAVIPRLEWLKPIFSSTSLEENGNVFHFGKSTTYKNIPFDVNSCQGFINSAANYDCFITKTFGCGRTANGLANNDVLSGALFLPFDFNSAEPIELRIAYVGDSASAVAVTLSVTMGCVLQGQTVYGTAASAIAGPTSTEVSQTVNITTAGQALGFVTIKSYMPWAKSVGTTGNTEQLFCFTVKRTSANAQKFVIVQISPYYNSYRTTGINRV
jgi:hypothetical protein